MFIQRRFLLGRSYKDALLVLIRSLQYLLFRRQSSGDLNAPYVGPRGLGMVLVFFLIATVRTPTFIRARDASLKAFTVPLSALRHLAPAENGCYHVRGEQLFLLP